MGLILIARSGGTKTPTTPGSRGFGGAGALIVIVTLLGLGRYVIVFRNTSNRAGVDVAVGELLRDAAVLVGALALLFTTLYLVAWAGRARQQRLAESHPDAIVVSCARTNSLVKLFKSGTLSRANDAPEMYFSVVFTLVADAEGIHLLGGSSALRLLYEAPWLSVREVLSGRLTDGGFSRQVLVFSICLDDQEIHLPMTALGGGLAGLYSVSQVNLDEIVASLTELRAKVLSPRDEVRGARSEE